MERSLWGGGGGCWGLIYLRSPPWSFPYIEMRLQPLNFLGAVVRVGEVKPCSHRASFTLLTKALDVTSSASVETSDDDDERDEEEGGDGCDS